MQARNLNDLYEKHQENYSGFKENSDLGKELFDKYLESGSYYILTTSRLLQDFGEFAGLMGIRPLTLQDLAGIESEMLKLDAKISQGKHDKFDQGKPFKHLGMVKRGIEEFSNNMELMQFFIESQAKNPVIFESIVQLVFADHGVSPSHFDSSSLKDPVEIIEEKITLFEKSKETLKQKIEQLREQCLQLGQSLLEQ